MESSTEQCTTVRITMVAWWHCYGSHSNFSYGIIWEFFPNGGFDQISNFDLFCNLVYLRDDLYRFFLLSLTMVCISRFSCPLPRSKRARPAEFEGFSWESWQGRASEHRCISSSPKTRIACLPQCMPDPDKVTEVVFPLH